MGCLLRAPCRERGGPSACDKRNRTEPDRSASAGQLGESAGIRQGGLHVRMRATCISIARYARGNSRPEPRRPFAEASGGRNRPFSAGGFRRRSAPACAASLPRFHVQSATSERKARCMLVRERPRKNRRGLRAFRGDAGRRWRQAARLGASEETAAPGLTPSER